jgi:crotonobetainyl-CoA:carnitine CoA-transferase CaiB-like acyl-CoA transferase
MGNPEWATWDIFQDQANRSKNYDVLRMYLEEWTQQWKVEELWHATQARRICVAPVFTMTQMAKQEQLHARNFFVDVTHPRAGKLTHLGQPYQLHEPWWRIRRPAPLLGEHNEEVKTETRDWRLETSSLHPSLKAQGSSLKPQAAKNP